MDSNIQSGYSNPQTDVNEMVTFDDILFTLECRGQTKLAKKFLRNYLKNFARIYKKEIGLYE